MKAQATDVRPPFFFGFGNHHRERRGVAGGIEKVSQERTGRDRRWGENRGDRGERREGCSGCEQGIRRVQNTCHKIYNFMNDGRWEGKFMRWLARRSNRAGAWSSATGGIDQEH